MKWTYFDGLMGNASYMCVYVTAATIQNCRSFAQDGNTCGETGRQKGGHGESIGVLLLLLLLLLLHSSCALH
eukprot:COSAG06_NODE_3190_length_5707_cov_57.591655_4_plen_72_part_00